jgi:hypothetical protein
MYFEMHTFSSFILPNIRAIITSRIYPQRVDSVDFGVFIDSGVLKLDYIKAWNMSTSFPQRKYK